MATVVGLAGPPAVDAFTTFESGQVRPLAMSPDGTQLFAVNTPDGQLEIFDVTASGLSPRASVPVGLEPVAVAARSNSEVWVVNHLSDSISIVDVASDPPRVVRTLLVGDEPRDIVFAGAGGSRAFITTAHRGQQRTNPSISAVPGAGDPQFTTASVGRADVWVFDAAALGSTIGGTPLRIVTLFGDTPRALAVRPRRQHVYAAIPSSPATRRR
jgi:YVTN family beta-propeller protein